MPSLVGLALRRACKTCKHKVEVLSYKYRNILLIIIRLCCAFTSMYRSRQLSDYDAVRVFRWYFIPRLNSTKSYRYRTIGVGLHVGITR